MMKMFVPAMEVSEDDNGIIMMDKTIFNLLFTIQPCAHLQLRVQSGL